MADEVTNPLGMSDEDFLNMAPPIVEEPVAVVEEPAAVEEQVIEPVQEQEQPVIEEPAKQAEQVSGEQQEEEKPDEIDPSGSTEGEKPKQEEKLAVETPTKEEPAPEKVEPKVEGEVAYVAPTNEVAQAVYKQLMSPLKANGKTIQLKSPEEAISLMQMGANYTKKLQDLQPYRKAVMMLQNADLLDEGKLDLLIAVSKGEPEAVKKIIKDVGIDPMDIDVSSDPAYLGGSHRVTNEEVNFRTILDELVATESGAETVRHIYNAWDQTSKDAVAADPNMMVVINQQRETGVYDLISTEIERRRMLGQILPSTPFLQAYTSIGKEMAEAATKQVVTEQPVPAKEPEVVATRTVAPKSNVENSEKAAAAASTRTASKKAQPITNFLSMSDEEFMKLDHQFKNRL